MQVEYYRCWSSGEGDRGQWDTDFIDIPDDTRVVQPDLDDAIRRRCAQLKWVDDIPPQFVGFYAMSKDLDDD